MDPARRTWFRIIVSIAAVLGVIGLLAAAGLWGTGKHSSLNFAIYFLAILGLHRLLGGVLGLLVIAMQPIKLGRGV
jgi:hypothetical protein